MKLGFISLLAILTATGCSKDEFKRLGYEAVQSKQQHECLKDPSAVCTDRESYNSYERNKEMRDTEPNIE